MMDYWYIGKDGIRVLARDLEDERDALRAELAAEKALADRLAHEIEHSGVVVSQGLIAYRKARGL